MTIQEKELSNLLKDIYYNAPYVGDEFMDTAKAIIAKYPQILATHIFSGNLYDLYNGLNEYIGKNVELFIREVIK